MSLDGVKRINDSIRTTVQTKIRRALDSLMRDALSIRYQPFDLVDNFRGKFRIALNDAIQILLRERSKVVLEH